MLAVGDVQGGASKRFSHFGIVNLALGLTGHLAGNTCGLQGWSLFDKTVHNLVTELCSYYRM